MRRRPLPAVLAAAALCLFAASAPADPVTDLPATGASLHAIAKRPLGGDLSGALPNPTVTRLNGGLPGSYSVSTSGTIAITNTTAATSPTTGALTVAGGIGVGGQLSAGNGLLGVSTNSNATAGNVGEYISATVVPASGVGLISGVAANVTSINLTAGDWDVSGLVGFSEGATTTSTEQNAAINTASAALPALPGDSVSLARITASATGDGNIIPTGSARLSLAITTTVYLVAQATFATSTCVAYGIIRARRVR